MNIFSRLMLFITPYKRNVILSVISNIFLSVFTVFSIPLLIPFFQILFDRKVDIGGQYNIITSFQLTFQKYVEDHGTEPALILICFIIIAVFFLRNLFRYLAQYFMAPVRTAIVRDVRQKLFDKYMDLPISYYAHQKKGDLLSRALNDVQEIEWSVLNGLEALFKSPLIIVGSLSFMLIVSVKLSLFVFILILFTAFIIGGISKSLRKESQNVQSSLGKLSTMLEENISGIKVIKAFDAENHKSKVFRVENNHYKDVLTKLLWRRDLSAPLSEFLGVSVVTVLLYIGTKLVFANELRPEVFFSFVFAFYQIIEPAKSFSTAWYNVQKGMAAIDRVDAVLASDNVIFESRKAIPKHNFDQNISFKKVCFEYPQSDLPALIDIDFTIQKGQSVAIVGHSGSGKSTLLDLIPRFHDVTSGSIEIDGINIKDITIDKLRSLFGIVTQESVLFHDTIESNILIGREFHEIHMEKALSESDSWEFINNLPFGNQTVIGDRGMRLSGGQKQRLNIARAIFNNPSILLLDEATSSLDTESEKNVQNALNKSMKGRTSIIVAHRMSTITSCDLIIVVEQGKIIETGNHESLMAKRGSYFDLISNQVV